jgi:hypothetical protein
MPSAEFEAAIPAIERLQTYALDGAATGLVQKNTRRHSISKFYEK